MFLPAESLYAEVLRRPGLFEQLQREFNVTLAGPATFSALLNALQMGFRSLALEQRSSEVWKILGAVRNEFARYNEVVDKLAKQLNTAAESVGKLGARTRAISKTLRDVERLPDNSQEAPAMQDEGAENARIGDEALSASDITS
jgi:DNA recombination protein RmuC